MEEIYNKYYYPLFSFAYKIIGDKEEAEDIVIECFTKFCKGNYGEMNNLKAFLFTSVKNACLNFLKHRRIQKLKEKNYIVVADTAENPTWYEVENHILKSIYERIQALPGRQKEIIRMYLAGKKTEEIASKLQIEKATIRSLKRAAINQIKEFFKTKNYDFTRNI